MFWKGKVSIFKQVETFLKQSDLSLLDLEAPELPSKRLCVVSKSEDGPGIANLLNAYFEDPSCRTKANITNDWIQATYVENQAIWIVAKDMAGTIRGCISSFRIKAPYPNSLGIQWGIVDWYCVHPLWRSKRIGTALLETLDYITYRIGRKAHIFLKEGYPLSLPHVPIYATWLKCRKAGNPLVKQMRKDTGLIVHSYSEVERSTGLPLIRLEGVTGQIKEWEDSLDTELPECWVFVSGSSLIDYKRGWQTDSLVSMYAFRWSPGRFLGSPPDPSIV